MRCIGVFSSSYPALPITGRDSRPPAIHHHKQRLLIPPLGKTDSSAILVCHSKHREESTRFAQRKEDEGVCAQVRREKSSATNLGCPSRSYTENQ